MKKTLLTLAVAVLAGSASFAQGKKLAPANQVENAVVNNTMKFNAEVHDYGTIEKGADGTHEFVFTNTGKEPIIIQNAKSSCGCTVPSYSKEPIAPGKTGAITVKYDTQRVGPINKSVTITSNVGTTVLQIKGNIERGNETSVPEQKVMMKQ